MGIREDIRYRYSVLSVAEKLIVINVLVFLLNLIIPAFAALAPNSIEQWFLLPKGIGNFIRQPWSIITYSFFHGGFMHLLFNMILLFFASRIFLNLLGGRVFLNVYFLGVILGGLFFLISYSIFPGLIAEATPGLIGASAGVTAILIFVCSFIPNQEVRLIFFNVKLWYIGAFFVLKDLIQLAGENTGGHLAHLGGALIGFLYARRLQEGRDIGAWFGNGMSSVMNLFKPRKKTPLRTVHRKQHAHATGNSTKRSATGTAYGKTAEQQKIDSILDKISKSGYESLSKEEKDFLFQAGKE